MALPVLTRFILASGMTNLADGMATVAWAWLPTLLTRDALWVAVIPVALRLPWLVFAIPAGIVTDRMDRRRLILRMDVLRALAFAAAALAIVLALPLPLPPARVIGQPALFAAILAAAFIVGLAEVFRDNAAQTLLPAIVPPEALETANGRLWSVELIGNALLGPALGAFLIAAALPLPFMVNALAYAMAIWLILRIPGNFQPPTTRARHWQHELREALAFLRRARLLRSLAWITGLWNLLFHMAMIALVLHVQENLGLAARAYGLVLAAGALGGIAGGQMGERIIRRFGATRTSQWVLVSTGPTFLAMALAPSAAWLGVSLAIFEFTGMIWNIVSVSYRQRAIPSALLGRVNSLYRLLAWGMMPAGLILSGLIVTLAKTLMPRPLALTMPFLVATLGALVLAAGGWRALRQGFPPTGTDER